jgi:hypothetical protein
MKTKKPDPARPAASKLPAKQRATSADKPPVEFDRRGKPLPPRQRVGGIITPQ